LALQLEAYQRDLAGGRVQPRIGDLAQPGSNSYVSRISIDFESLGTELANFGIGNREVDYDEDWLGVPMFWSSFDLEGAHAALASGGFELLIDRVETEIEDDRPHRSITVLAQAKPQ
jgi:hypothetical protein